MHNQYTNPNSGQYVGDDIADNWFQIHYHLWWPAPGNDPFCQYNLSLNQARNNYYGNNYTPHMLTGGGDSGSSTAAWRNDAINMVGQYTPISIEMNGGILEYDITVSLSISSEIDLSAQPTRLFIAATMDSVQYTGTNGLPIHHHTIIDFLMGDTGDPIVLNGVDDVVLNYEWSMDPSWPNNAAVSWEIENLDVIAFVQNYSTKEIYQVEGSRVNEMNSDVDDDGVNNSVDNCPNDYNPNQEDIDSDGMGDACDMCDNANVYVAGNVNGDVLNNTPVINLFDVLMLVDLILAADYPGCTGESANFNSDNYINVLDVVQLARYIAGFTSRETVMIENSALILISQDEFSTQIEISSPAAMGGLQFELPANNIIESSLDNVILPDGWILSYREVDGTMRVMIVDLSAENGQQSFSMDLKGFGEFESIMISSSDGQNIPVEFDKKETIDSISIPSTVMLNELYPNPFNPTVSIPFSLPFQMDARISVFNLNGQLVEVLMDEREMVGGPHQLSWNAAQHASGVYLVQIQTAQGVDTKKAFLLK